MKKDRSILYFAIGISLFVGFIIVSIALGAIFPSIHKLTAPLICRGTVEVETVRYSYKPGQVGWQHTVYCVPEAGAKKDITFPAIGMTGLVASVIIFAYLAFRWRKELVVEQKDFGVLAADLKPKKSGKKGSALERLAELKKMRDENLISEAEYDRKKQEIMNEL